MTNTMHSVDVTEKNFIHLAVLSVVDLCAGTVGCNRTAGFNRGPGRLLVSTVTLPVIAVPPAVGAIALLMLLGLT
jgi:hypothetical protein